MQFEIAKLADTDEILGVREILVSQAMYLGLKLVQLKIQTMNLESAHESIRINADIDHLI